MNGDRGTVVVLLAVAFLVFTVGRSPDNVQLPESQALVSWAALAIILGIAVDIGPTSEVAAALALLIFVTIMLLYGVPLFDWLNRKTGNTASGGGGGKKRA